ncbi:putative autophagy protein Apg6 [Lepidopterella palustris CBS 459.81]|uniref:Putative autophagy protein Apg6 n=1 Tax=Lepidopterella palustris CBS 459.81 TaxID=1314670 RepID=A0A8E2JFT3_9PEZI|nr:putative autophagy protein Apg6 [Lepidopterella palustris CBS 459.81]
MYCQKCRTPVKLDVTVEELNPAAFKLLTDSTTPPQQPSATTSSPRQSRPAYSQDRREDYHRALQDARAPTFKRTIPSSRYSQHGAAGQTRSGSKDNPAMSFVMLTESQVVQTPSHRHEDEQTAKPNNQKRSITSGRTPDDIETTDRLFDILSARTDIDHPICVECTELLVDGMQKRLASTVRERDAYVEFLRKANTEVPSEDERQQALEGLRKAREREGSAFMELEKLEQIKAALDQEMAASDEEARKLDRIEEDFWRERNSFAATLATLLSEKEALNTRYDHDTKQLQRLQRTNIYNDTFCIGHDGYFGTINALRLGRLSNPLVEWAEINAAWGQTCLLLATVAERLGFSFQGYRLNPMGSASTIEKLDYPQSNSTNDPSHPVKPRVTSLELYCTGDLPLGLGFLHRRFDNAMVAFLECLRQLGDYVEHAPAQSTGSATQGLRMPYEIRKDKIHDTSIKLSFNQEESWTKACKYTLTCCKYLLAHASNMSNNPPRRSL